MLYGTNGTPPATKNRVFTVPSNSKWQKCEPVEPWAGWRGALLHWWAFRSVGVARNSNNRSLVAAFCGIWHIPVLEEWLPADVWIFSTGKISLLNFQFNQLMQLKLGETLSLQIFGVCYWQKWRVILKACVLISPLNSSEGWKLQRQLHIIKIKNQT